MHDLKGTRIDYCPICNFEWVYLVDISRTRPASSCFCEATELPTALNYSTRTKETPATNEESPDPREETANLSEESSDTSGELIDRREESSDPSKESVATSEESTDRREESSYPSKESAATSEESTDRREEPIDTSEESTDTSEEYIDRRVKTSALNGNSSVGMIKAAAVMVDYFDGTA